MRPKGAITPIQERILLRELSSGSAKAFESLFMYYFPKLKLFLSGFTDCVEEAEDLSQDVFVKLWQSRENLVCVENLNAYLYRIAKNTLYSYWEKELKLNVSQCVPEVPSTDKLEEILFAREVEELVDAVIMKMPPQRRNIFIMSRKQGLKNEEIAERLHISRRTVETHISAALADIRKILPAILLFFS